MNPAEKTLFKQLSREEMKNVSGGVAAPPSGGGFGTYTCNTTAGSYQIVE